MLLAAYIWWTGPSAFLVGRRVRVFTRTPLLDAGKRLVAAADLLHTSGPVAAYLRDQNGVGAWLDGYPDRLASVRAALAVRRLPLPHSAVEQVAGGPWLRGCGPPSGRWLVAPDGRAWRS
jgi:hypothetical protein